MAKSRGKDNTMKTVSIVVPTYNEEKNIPLAIERIRRVFAEHLPGYGYEIIFADNCSQDGTRGLIREYAREDKRIKAIFNARNFGFSRSTFYGLSQAEGDCAVLLFADMQDPPELILDFIREWENGNKIVIGIKNKSEENRLVYLLRSAYYKVIKRIGEIDHIEQFTGFGLYDRSFIEVLRGLRDPMPYLRGIVAELGFQYKKVFYTQQKRVYGKTSFGFWKLYDVMMLGITSYSKAVLRMATLMGFGIAAVSLLIAAVTFILKIFGIVNFDIGIAAISIGVYFFGSMILFFIGMLGEYIVNINIRTMGHPLVVEEERINFEKNI